MSTVDWWSYLGGTKVLVNEGGGIVEYKVRDATRDNKQVLLEDPDGQKKWYHTTSLNIANIIPAPSPF